MGGAPRRGAENKNLLGTNTFLFALSHFWETASMERWKMKEKKEKRKRMGEKEGELRDSVWFGNVKSPNELLGA